MDAKRTSYKSLANMMVTRLIPNVTEDMRETEADNFLQYIKRLEKSMKSPDPYNRARSSTKKKSQQKNHSFHKPSFDMMVYDSADLLEFVCTYYEMAESYNENEKLVGRRAKNYYDNKIDFDKDYDFIFNLLKKCDPQTDYVNYDANTANWVFYYNKQREKTWLQALNLTEELFNIAMGNSIDNDILSRLKRIADDDNKFSLAPSNPQNYYCKSIIYEAINLFFHSYISAVIGTVRSELIQIIQFRRGNIKEFNGILGKINTYRSTWQLANWAILEALRQQLIQKVRHGIDSIDFVPLQNNLDKIADKIYSNISSENCNKSDNLYGGFYLYHYMLTVYNEYAKDEEIAEDALEEIYGEKLYDTKSNISEEYSFFDEYGILSSSASTANNEKERFHLGGKTCTQETFEKRLEFCRKFIEFYDQKTPRYLNAKNISVLRAVYKTFYISGLTYKDKSIYTLAKDLMKSNDYSKLMLNHHVIGAVIDRENYCEMRNGIEIYKAVTMLSKSINKIFLYTFYRDCPRLEDTDIENPLCELISIFTTVERQIKAEFL